MQKYVICGSAAGSCDLVLTSVILLHILGMAIVVESIACNAFDAAFAKLF